MQYVIYWLVSEDLSRTYIGFSNNIKRRVKEHYCGQVNTTKCFGKFRCYILEKIDSEGNAIIQERYWKSCSGRKKLKEYYQKLINMPPSSNG